MTASKDPGRFIVAALPGPDLGAADEAALRDLRPAGVILFARNLKSPSQTRDLLAGVRETLGEDDGPLFLAVDQEGGRVNRLAEIEPVFRALPDGRVQAGWPAERLEEVWRRVGVALGALGFNVDFTPVVDLDDGDGRNAIGPRSFGTDPGRVAACAARVLAGLASAGIAGCIKHFPGLGGTDLDTHVALATSPLSRAELESTHVRPYRDLRRAAPMVMTSHAHYPAIDGPDPLPGTFSRRMITGWLREELGFEGLIVSDDLEMGAVAALEPPGGRAVRALAAGADVVLFCKELDNPRRARDTVAQALAAGRLPDDLPRTTAARLRAALTPGAARAGAAGTGAAVAGVDFDEAASGLADAIEQARTT